MERENILTLKDEILAKTYEFWESRVARMLQYFWDEQEMNDLSRRFELLWEEILATEAHYQHNMLVDYVTYYVFLGEQRELTRRFSVYDEDRLVEDFREIPEWEIRLESWEEGDAKLIDDLTHLDVVRLLLFEKNMLEAETSNLALYLGARIPAYTPYKRERMIATFLAVVLDEYSGRLASLPDPCATDREYELKCGYLYGKISEYRALKLLRERILANDI